MANAVFALSTGRCSTQFLAKVLADALPDALVEHEPIGAAYLPRKIFRRPAQVLRVLGGSVPLQRKLIQIEDLLADGRTYIDTGWPTYAWVPYLETRFGDRLRFLHIVRNPFATAASLLTHGLFAGAGKGLARHALIYGTDPGILHSEFRAEYAGFSPFEKCLLHWIEVNAFLHEQRERAGSLGLVRFEDVYGGEASGVQDVAESLAGQSLPPIPTQPFDRYQKKLDGDLRLTHPDLAEAAIGLAVTLGYDEADLRATFDLETIAAQYRKLRHERAKPGRRRKA